MGKDGKISVSGIGTITHEVFRKTGYTGGVAKGGRQSVEGHTLMTTRGRKNIQGILNRV